MWHFQPLVRLRAALSRPRFDSTRPIADFLLCDHLEKNRGVRGSRAGEAVAEPFGPQLHRVPVSIVVGSRAGGMTFEDVWREYDLTVDDIRAALKFAADLTAEESFHPCRLPDRPCDFSWTQPAARGGRDRGEIRA